MSVRAPHSPCRDNVGELARGGRRAAAAPRAFSLCPISGGNDPRTHFQALLLLRLMALMQRKLSTLNALRRRAS